MRTDDGGYIVAGETGSFGVGGTDGMVIKLDDSGSIVWQGAYGGDNDDVLTSIDRTDDGGHIAAGGAGFFDYLDLAWGPPTDTLIGPIPTSASPIDTTFVKFPAAAVMRDIAITPTVTCAVEQAQCSR